jgi:3-methyladenine DNA glycosylase AlkD
MVGDPQTITRSTMDRWTRDFNSWDVCDSCCCNLFDRTPHAWAMIGKWAWNKREYVRRAAFAMLAGIAVPDKTAADQLFLDSLALIETCAFDDRNFVRKAVNRVLRNVGKRNAGLLPAAIACAERTRAQGSRARPLDRRRRSTRISPKGPMLKFGYRPFKPCKTSSRDLLPKSIPPLPISSSPKHAAKTARSN